MLVLVVDDEPISRMAHLAVLAKIRGLSAIGASSVAEARAMIQEAPPQVVVLDMRLPDGTGMDVIVALEAVKANAVVIVASAYLEDYRTKLPRSERIHLLGKPVPMHELRRIVEASMSNTNILGPFTVIDYVQLACMGHHSAIIECMGSAGRGEIVIERGELWSAVDPQGSGLPAFERLLLARKASAQQLGEQHVRVPRNLHDRWELLILDALRTQDERGGKAAGPPGAESPGSKSAAAVSSKLATPTSSSAPEVSKPAASPPASPAKAAPQAVTATPTPAPAVAPTPAAPTTAPTPAAPTPATPTPATPAAAPSPAKAAPPGPASPASPASPPGASGKPAAPSSTPEQHPTLAVSVKPAVLHRSAQAQTLELVRPEPAPSPRIQGTQSPATTPPSDDSETGKGARRDDGFDACIERALRAVVAKNFALAIAELEQAQAIRPGDPLVIHRLARLRSLQG